VRTITLEHIARYCSYWIY